MDYLTPLYGLYEAGKQARDNVINPAYSQSRILLSAYEGFLSEQVQIFYQLQRYHLWHSLDIYKQ